MSIKPLALHSIVALICLVSTVNAAELTGGSYTKKIEGNYELVTSALQDAIINQGLVVDYTGRVGDMLARTGEDVGESSPYANASFLLFCSAKATHSAVAADPRNIALCPYTVFSYELKKTPGEIVVGYRRPFGSADAASKKAVRSIEHLLQSIVDDAAQ